MIISIILRRLSFSLAIAASIKDSVSKTDLKEGDNVDITIAVSLNESEVFSNPTFLFR